MQLVLPNWEHEAMVMNYRAAFKAAGDKPYGASGLLRYVSYSDWLDRCRNASNEETCEEGRVPQTVYIAIDNDEMVGAVVLRYQLNDDLLKYAGHMAFSVHPKMRRRGYGKQILSAAVNMCRDKGIDKVLLTCDKDNIASKHLIESCGGALENEIMLGDKPVLRYWINTGR